MDSINDVISDIAKLNEVSSNLSDDHMLYSVALSLSHLSKDDLKRVLSQAAATQKCFS